MNLRRLARPALVWMALSAVYAYSEEVVVAVSPIAPLVIESGGQFSGFDVDLWEAIARQCGLNSSYREVEFKEIIPSLISGAVDVGLAGITINAEREILIDFSHPYLNSGLRILVSSRMKTSLLGAFSSVFTPSVVRAVTLFFAFIFIFGHVLWWSERGEVAINDRYFPGIFEAFWCVLATMTTVGYGDVAPRKWLGRFAAFVVMICGIGLFGVIIAQLSAELNFQKLVSDISSHEDLKGKRVATVGGTTSVATLKDLGADVLTVGTIDEAYRKLIEETVEAVVFDSPSLLYYAKNEGTGKVTVVGDLFDLQYYGISFMQGSALRERVNRALLTLRANGEYDRIYAKYFGAL